MRLIAFRIVGTEWLAASQCGVIIAGQRVMTLGAGDLDAYTCLRLREVRSLPDGRVGLLYDAASPNTSLRTTALLHRGAAGRWEVQPEATTVWDDLPVKSWPAFAAALARGRVR